MPSTSNSWRTAFFRQLNKGKSAMLHLIDAQKEYLPEYKEAYLMSLKKIGEGVIKEHDLMFIDPDEVDVVQRFLDNRNPLKLKPGYVPAYDYFVVDGNRFVGSVSIRTALTPKLLQFGGHIGYGIHPKYWRQGYGTEALRLALDKAREIGLKDRVLVTCDDDNVGSYRVIEKNGGVLENKVENTEDGETFLTRRYWITL